MDREQPLDPIYVQPTPRKYNDLDVQPSRGPREAVNITGDIIDNYFEENLMDVLKVSGLGSNFSAYLQPTKDSKTTVHPSDRPDMAPGMVHPRCHKQTTSEHTGQECS